MHAGRAAIARILASLRCGAAAAAVCGTLHFGPAGALSAADAPSAQSSVLFKLASQSASNTSSTSSTGEARDDRETTVFRKPKIAATAIAARQAKATKASDDAPLQWRVRTSGDNTTAAAAARAPSASKTAVRQAQFEADVAPAESSGPVLRAANDSVLLPPPATAKSPSGRADGVSPSAPRRLTPANRGQLRTAQRATGDPPSESLTQPDTADDIFAEQPPATAAPPADLPADTPAPTTPAPTTPAPSTPMPSDAPTVQPETTPPAADAPPTDIAPPARLPMPQERELPLPEPGLSAAERDRRMDRILFGIDAEGVRHGGELDACDETEIELKGKRVVGISLDISPPPPDIKSDWSYDRPWKDVTGKTLFTGRPTALDAITDEATFVTVDGETKRIKLQELSRVEQGYFLAMYPLPVECHMIDEPYRGRNWIASTYTWKASGACHKPLYFEDVHLERYGHSVGPILQPLASSAHFFGTLPILPYKMGVHPPNECIYTLGYYRPGNCAPYMLDPLPLSVRGALFEAGAWVGGVAVIP